MTRFAFLTDEFVTQRLTGGGLATYVDRMARTLVAAGVEVEVFVRCTDRHAPPSFEHHGILVHPVSNRHPLYGALARLPLRFLKEPWGGAWAYLRTSSTMARAFLARHREKPFHAVQATNSSALGLFLPPLPGCRRLIRLSSHREQWFRTDNLWHLRGARLLAALERRAIRRADVVYAPSEFVAAQCRQAWRSDVAVLRPPVFVEEQPEGQAPRDAPARFLLHFGRLCHRKGTVCVAEALPHVWREEPEFRMVWAGVPGRDERLTRAMAEWGPMADRVTLAGRIPKRTLYRLVLDSECCVLPSLVDNLPNSVVEALALGKGVLGFRGGSVDELVEDGTNGLLADPGDVEGLARLMVAVWRGEFPWVKGPVPPPAAFESMEPRTAARNLLDLAGLGAQP